jgi:hypothetical protein
MTESTNPARRRVAVLVAVLVAIVAASIVIPLVVSGGGSTALPRPTSGLLSGEEGFNRYLFETSPKGRAARNEEVATAASYCRLMDTNGGDAYTPHAVTRLTRLGYVRLTSELSARVLSGTRSLGRRRPADFHAWKWASAVVCQRRAWAVTNFLFAVSLS